MEQARAAGMSALELEATDLEVDPATIPGLKFHTPRRYDLPTYGHRQRDFARVWIGRNFMPWQSLVANVLGEYDPTTGLRVHGFAVVTVQRRAGKSDLVFVRASERCFTVPGFRFWYTAQKGQEARDEFLKFFTDTLDAAPLRHAVELMRGRGEEVARFPNRATMRPFPPTEEKLHGKDTDEVVDDEAWSRTLEAGRALMQAVGPTQLTRPGAQTSAWSAGGTPASTYLADLVAQGRAGADFPYFEFGIPDDADAGDLEVIAAHHPAYGYTIDLEGFRKLREKMPDDDDWARAAGNRWTSVIGSAIDAKLWLELRYGSELPETPRLGWGAARAEDGSHVALACATILEDGRAVAELVDVFPTYRAAETVLGWIRSDPCGIDPEGPSAPLADDLAEKKRKNVHLLAGRQAGAACQDLLDGMRDRRYLFRQHPELDAAAAVCQKRTVGDGGVRWSRSTAAGSVAPLEAITWAIREARHVKTGKPGFD
jgi:hypothetical protein